MGRENPGTRGRRSAAERRARAPRPERESSPGPPENDQERTPAHRARRRRTPRRGRAGERPGESGKGGRGSPEQRAASKAPRDHRHTHPPRRPRRDDGTDPQSGRRGQRHGRRPRQAPTFVQAAAKLPGGRTYRPLLDTVGRLSVTARRPPRWRVLPDFVGSVVVSSCRDLRVDVDEVLAIRQGEVISKPLGEFVVPRDVSRGGRLEHDD